MTGLQPDRPLRIVIADDQTAVRDGLAIMLDLLPDITVVGAAANGVEALDLIEAHRPDVALIDLHMPILDGIEAARQILSHHLVPIVMSTGMSDAMTVHRAIDLNLISYLVKPFSPAQLKVAVQLAVAQCRMVGCQDAISTAA